MKLKDQCARHEIAGREIAGRLRLVKVQDNYETRSEVANV